jgi:hypothetical protein
LADLGIAAEDRIDFPRLRHRREIDRESRAPDPAATPDPSETVDGPSGEVTALAASLLPAVTAAKSRFNASAGMRRSWPDASRARRANSSSANNAHSR